MKPDGWDTVGSFLQSKALSLFWQTTYLKITKSISYGQAVLSWGSDLCSVCLNLPVNQTLAVQPKAWHIAGVDRNLLNKGMRILTRILQVEGAVDGRELYSCYHASWEPALERNPLFPLFLVLITRPPIPLPEESLTRRHHILSPRSASSERPS